MFRFKRFLIDDSLCAMKVGTDGVLLGAWADVEGDCRLLDVGSGSGIITLMLAQRNAAAHVTAIDIDAGAVEATRRNAEASPWGERIAYSQCDIVDYKPDTLFDHIISNPPYFERSLLSPDAQRSVARHTSSLSFEALVTAACRLLNQGGRLSVILPRDGAAHLRRIAFGRLWLRRLTDVVTREGDAPCRTLMEFERCARPLMPRCDVMTIEDGKGEYTEEYRRLTEDFYLKF